jgi:hypothetical protein
MAVESDENDGERSDFAMAVGAALGVVVAKLLPQPATQLQADGPFHVGYLYS